MFSISCESLLSFVPLVLALFWPFMASFFGLETVLRQSLVICVYFIICDLFEKAIHSILKDDLNLLKQFVNTIVLIILFSQPFITIPSFIISLFSLLIKYCEPLIILIEIIQLVRIVNRFGFFLSENIYSNESETKSFILKLIVIFITTISYSFAFFIIRNALINAETLLFTYASILLILFQVILIIATIYIEEGIISNTAIVFLFSSLALYLSVFDNKYQNSNAYHQMEWLETTQMSSNGKSLIYQLLSLPDVSTAYASEAVVWAKQHYGIAFWSALVIRITCVLYWLIDHNQLHYEHYNDDERSSQTIPSIETNGSYLGVSTNTLIKVMATLIYTQMLSQQLPADSWPSLSIQWLQSLFRVIQCYSLGIYYFYTLFAITTDD